MLKPLDDLRQAVEHYQRRMALRAAVAAMPKLEGQRRDLDDQIAEADRVLEAAEKQHDETTLKCEVRSENVEMWSGLNATSFAPK
ncbi:MAG: hypothetical protein WD049_01300 [Candidatus Paceibacterota bacterium]